ncbi:AAC(3) family N-acetyltransferase [Pedococcus sp. 5OH_020]|uniref:AAC(3) family N-acetyltransferase n=1 Tax=Pedococcus sp. 5OH_020 TaxID=2989814 RepID=UPI0022EA0FA6|nr:AAC(3) family N-acetyltransferase [Pedococcus sp. 5OH_020]
MGSLNEREIGAALERLGLRRRHHVLLHSSLSSLGHVERGSAAVVQALLDVVGDDGTVLAPTLTGNEHIGPDTTVRFDVARSAAWTGRIAETVRSWPAAVRSVHPTHSVAAVGGAAERLTAGHEDCVTPCGAGSPYARLAADPDGVILLLGCDHESNTTLHHVEELAGVPYHLQPSPVPAVIETEQGTLNREYWVHRYGTPRRFSAIEPLLLQRGLQRTDVVGQATARLVPAGALVSFALEVLRAAPEFFVADGAQG